MKTNWPEASIFIAAWLSVASMVFSLSRCDSEKYKARQEACRNATCID